MSLASLESLVVPVIEGIGYRFIGMECTAPTKVTIYVDNVDKEMGNISTQDCQLISQRLHSVLSVEAQLKHSYVLEISSPGVDRKLFTLEHFMEQVGETVNLTVSLPTAASKKIVGILQQVKGDQLHILTTSGSEKVIDFAGVQGANVVYKW